MAGGEGAPLLRRVTLTSARNLSPLFDVAVRKGQPVMIVRGGREHGLLVELAAMQRLLAAYDLTVDVLPEEGGSFSLWLNELEIGATGSSLAEARQALLAVVRAYVTNYLNDFELYQHLPDRARLQPYVLRLALAESDAELARELFGAPTQPDVSPAATSA